MPRFTLLLPMRRDGERIPTGETVELSTGEARPLLDARAITPSNHRPEPVSPPPPPPPAATELPDEAALKELTKAQIVAQAKLEGLELDEAAKKDGLITALLTARKPADESGDEGDAA